MSIAAYTTLTLLTIQNHLIFEEGLKLEPYKCTEGHCTIGVGRNLDVKPLTARVIGRNLTKRSKITREEALLILNYDIEEVLVDLNKRLPFFKELPPEQQLVLISLGFQLGIGGLWKFQDFLAAVNKQDKLNMVKELKDSRWAHQTPNRCLRLCSYIQKGLPPNNLYK